MGILQLVVPDGRLLPGLRALIAGTLLVAGRQIVLAEGYEIAVCLAETPDKAAIVNDLRQAKLRGGRCHRSHRGRGHRTCGWRPVLGQRQLEGRRSMQIAAKFSGRRKEVGHIRAGIAQQEQQQQQQG